MIKRKGKNKREEGGSLNYHKHQLFLFVASKLYGVNASMIIFVFVLYCIVLYCILLYCIVLYFIVLYCIVLYCIVLYCIVLYCIVLFCIVLYCIVLYCILLYCIVLYCIVFVGLNFYIVVLFQTFACVSTEANKVNRFLHYIPYNGCFFILKTAFDTSCNQASSFVYVCARLPMVIIIIKRSSA